MQVIEELERAQLRTDIPDFRAGDTVVVDVKITEGGKTRTQAYEGVVIRRRGCGTRATFTVRRISYGEGVERTFPLHSPNVASVKVVRKGDVRRSRLYYLRERAGKQARIKERAETQLS